MNKLFVLASFVLALGLFATEHTPRGPVIVADFAESEQTTRQSQTFTPSSDGTFRVSAYLEVSGKLERSSVTAVTLSYTDDLEREIFNSSAGGAPTIICSAVGERSVAICQGTVVIHAKGNEPIIVGFVPWALSPGSSYTAYAIVEQL